MTSADNAARFKALHVKGNPVVLYNAWDAGSAKAIAAAGAKAIATSSYAIAAAQGHSDGEDTPRDLVERIAAKVVEAVDLPVTIDFEGGYSEDEAGLAANVARLLDLGVVGINFEDRVVKGSGLYGVERQALRVAAIRKAAAAKGVDLFINARTDLFLGRGAPDPADSVGEALERAAAYAAAGASGFFVPGLTDQGLIGRIVEGAALPVNVMFMPALPALPRLKDLGVARLSYGATPYLEAMRALGERASQVYG